MFDKMTRKWGFHQKLWTPGRGGQTHPNLKMNIFFWFPTQNYNRNHLLIWHLVLVPPLTEGCHTRCVQCTHCAYCFRFGFNIGHVTPTVFLAPKRVIYILNSRQNSKKAIEMRIAHTCNGNHISLPILLALVIEVHFHKHQCWKQSASRNASGTRARRNISPVLQCFDISVLWYNRYEQCSLIDSF